MTSHGARLSGIAGVDALRNQPSRWIEGETPSPPDGIISDGYFGIANSIFGPKMELNLYGGDGFWAIEVTNSGKVRPHDLRGIRAFHCDYPQATPLLLYRGTEPMLIDGIHCRPADGFLRGLHPSRPVFSPSR